MMGNESLQILRYYSLYDTASCMLIAEQTGLFIVLPSFYRWKGDHGGKVQLFFPSNYVEEVSNNTKPETKDQVKIIVEVTV